MKASGPYFKRQLEAQMGKRSDRSLLLSHWLKRGEKLRPLTPARGFCISEIMRSSGVGSKISPHNNLFRKSCASPSPSLLCSPGNQAGPQASKAGEKGGELQADPLPSPTFQQVALATRTQPSLKT